ncbi:MAG TPA: AzlD domain-containing protein [Xanthobacteraceae bacterium]|jgi:hypothetical protein
MSMSAQLSPVLVLILAGFVPSDLWRLLGVVVGHGLDEKSDLVTWVRAVAIAILGGVIANLAFAPPGSLAQLQLPVRLSAIAIGFLAFILAKRSVFIGVLSGELALVAGGFWF